MSLMPAIFILDEGGGFWSGLGKVSAIFFKYAWKYFLVNLFILYSDFFDKNGQDVLDKQYIILMK